MWDAHLRSPPRKDRRCFDLISEALPFGRLWYQQADAAVGYAKFYSRSQPGEVRVFDAAGAMIAADSWQGDFRERYLFLGAAVAGRV